MNSYITLFLNSAFASGDVNAAISLLFLFLARFLPIVALSPFFGARVLPHPVKVTFAISMFTIFLPKLLQVTTSHLSFNPYLMILFAKEFVVGMVIGTVISMPFAIIQNVGIMIDHQRGGASLMVNDPTVQNQSSPLGTLFNMTLIWLFFAIDAPFLFLDAIMTSYDVVPPDQFIAASFFEHSSNSYKTMIALFNQVMVISIQLATPGLLAILMTDVFLGIANRLAPQVQITFLGMPLKSLLALLIVCLGWKFFNEQMVKQSYYWINQVVSMISDLNPANFIAK